MTAPLSPEVLLHRENQLQADLPLCTEGVARWVWEGRYGAMLIEVVDGVILVNGKRVEPHRGFGQGPEVSAARGAGI